MSCNKVTEIQHSCFKDPKWTSNQNLISTNGENLCWVVSLNADSITHSRQVTGVNRAMTMIVEKVRETPQKKRLSDNRYSKKKLS